MNDSPRNSVSSWAHRHSLIVASVVLVTASLGLTNACQVPFLPSQSLDLGSSGDANSDRMTPPSGVKFKYQCDDPSTRGTADDGLKRLTRSELVNTLNDLLGSEIASLDSVQAQLGVLPSDKITTTVDELSENHSADHLKAILEIATIAGDEIFNRTEVRDRIFGSCSAQTNISDDCAKNFINNFGLRAFRRPLTGKETASIFANFKEAGGQEGLKRALIRLLASPAMAYHVETGANEVGGRVRLTDYEVASRISYRTVGTMPDQALFDAAEKGELQDLSNVSAHVKRLLENHPLAREQVWDFFQFYMHLFKAGGDPSAGVGAAKGIDVEGLGAEMVQEFQEFVLHVIFEKKGSFQDLLSSREVFPRSERMAKILGTSVATGSEPSLTSNAHRGMLLRPVLFADSGDRTNPMRRGVLFRKRVLCTDLGAPNPDAVDEVAEEVGPLDELPNREGYHRLTGGVTCIGCHALVNPLGFALEGYDQLGMLRTQEIIFSTSGEVIKQFPIDTYVERPLLGDAGSPTALTGADQLVTALTEGDTARSCFSKTVFEFQRLRAATKADHCALREIEAAATSGGTVLEAFEKTVATEDIFWKSL